MTYWAVGASFGKVEDMSQDFINKKYWYDGYYDNGDLRNESLLNDVKINDIFVMKSSGTKGERNNSQSFTRLKAIGIVLKKTNKYSFEVDWFYTERKDFDDTWYSKTLSRLNNNEIKKFVNEKIVTYRTMKEYIPILEQKGQIILQGAPGTGKTRLAKQIAEEAVKRKGGEHKLVQFHPAYTYEDFVRGIVAKTQGNTISYTVENKILAEMAETAKQNPEGSYVLIIDEINRANLPAVLGELIHALEYRDEPVDSLYALNGNRQITLPSNLYIIGTMNTADRSVGHIDYAIRRRFAFVTVPPDESAIKNTKAQDLFKKIKAIFDTDLSSDFEKGDIMIGHSYFLVEKDEELETRLTYEIKPLLREYVKDGILTCKKEDIENLTI